MIKKYRNFKTNFLSNGILVIGFDNKDKPVNILSSAVLEEFSFIVKLALLDTAVKGFVLVSLKNGSFIAGADIKEIRAMTDKNACKKLVKGAHELFHTIESSQKPFVAAIEGACLGGGLELALACHWRVASDHPNTAFALPEVLLGIIPGFGGTQRLPRLIGIAPALEMITSGKTIFPKKAIKTGLIDDLVKSVPSDKNEVEWPRSTYVIVAVQRALELASGKKVKPRTSFFNRTLGRPFIQGLVCRKARKMILAKTDGHYPAPLEALEAVRKGYGIPLQNALLEEEMPRIINLVVSPLSKNLVDIFLSSEKLKPTKTEGINSAKDTLGVLGAGPMGSQIAANLAEKGYTVNLRDLSAEYLRKGMDRIFELECKDLAKRVISQPEFDQRLLRLKPTTDWEKFRKSSLVIEAIKEVLEWKIKLLEEFESVAGEDAIFATNTSSYTVAEIAQNAKHPERCIAMHFFNPLRSMKLVEIGVADFTNLGTLTKTIELSRQLGKLPIVVRDSPGFLVNRILSRYLIESLILVAEGVPRSKVDLAAKKFGMAIDSGKAMGPLELINYVGIETCIHIIKSLEKLGPRIENRTIFETVLRGEYRTEESRLPREEITKRLILPMVDEAIRCLNESIVKSPEQADLAMLYGAGFPAFTGGLLKWAKNEGLDKIEGELGELAGKYGTRYTPCDNFKI